MIDRETGLWIYNKMNEIRDFEETAWTLFTENKLRGSVHLYTGEEAIAASVCAQLMERFPRAKKVIITLRGSVNANHNTWKGVLFADGRLYQSREYDITHIVDRVGGGDSFMGGLIYGLLSYPGDDQRALDFAVSSSCLKQTIYGDFNQVTVEEVDKLMSGDASGRVSR